MVCFAGGGGGEGGVDGGEEVGVVDWFGEDVEGAVFHGADGEGDGAVACEEDDGDVEACGVEEVEEVEPAGVRHLDIEDETVRRGRVRGVEGEEDFCG